MGREVEMGLTNVGGSGHYTIPLQIHLHKSEAASHPALPPALFKDSLPPGEDFIWFGYKGLPLKWYIPTGVLFDLLCAKPEKPCNLTIHFRGYPSKILIPCQGQDSVKWNFVNSLKDKRDGENEEVTIVRKK